MQVKSRLVGPLAWGIWGGLVMWFFAATGWNNWTTTSSTNIVVGYVLSVLIYGYCGYIFTSGKRPAVRVSVMTVAVTLGLALNWLSQNLGITSWINDGTTPWHAAVGGFVIFAISGAIYPYFPRPTKG
jgi:hypothetical protein